MQFEESDDDELGDVNREVRDEGEEDEEEEEGVDAELDLTLQVNRPSLAADQVPQLLGSSTLYPHFYWSKKCVH